MRYLPSGPLLDAARAGRPWHLSKDCTACESSKGAQRLCVTAASIADLIGSTSAAVGKWRTYGTQIDAADAGRFAAALGLVDFEVWPELLERAIEDVQRRCVTCGGVFVGGRSDKRYCDASCRNRSPERMAKQRERSAAYARNRYETDPEYRAAQLARRRTYAAAARRSLSAKQRAYYQRTAETQRAARRARYWAGKEAA